MVRYGNIFIFCSHYYRIKAIGRADQGGGSSSSGVAPSLGDRGHRARFCTSKTFEGAENLKEASHTQLKTPITP